MDIGRAIATAKRLIETNGQAVVWRKPASADPAAKPWRDVRTGDPTDTAVKIVWITPKLTRLAFLELAKGINIPAGVRECLMPAYAFEPELTDTVVVDGIEQSVYRVDPIKPNGTPVFYRVYLNRAGE